MKLLSKTEVVIDSEIDKMYPHAIPNEITVEHVSGTYSARVDFPKGHPKNPMSLEEVITKFRRLTRHYLTEDQQNRIVDTVLKLEEIDFFKPSFM